MQKFVHSCFSILLFGLYPALNISAVSAENDAERSVSFSGFGTVGAVYNRNDQLDFVRGISQKQGAGATHRLDFGVDSSLGLQMDITPSDQLKGVVQVLSHQRSGGNYSPEVTWAFAQYAPVDNVALRLGRLGFDVYMLADSRNVGYSYQWVRPPVEFFGGLPLAYLDGADAVVKHPLGDGIASVKIFAGHAREKALIDAQNYFDLSGSRILGSYAEYQTTKWLYRLGYTQVRYANQLPTLPPFLAGLRQAATAFEAVGLPGAAASANAYANLTDNIGKTVRYVNAGAVYEDGPLQAQMMLGQYSFSSPLYRTIKFAYLSAGYRMKKWTPYFTYATAVTPHSEEISTGLPIGTPLDPLVIALNNGAHQAQLAQQVNQRSLSIGTRYDFMPNADIKFQVDRVKNNASPIFWRNAQAGWNGQATVFSVALDFVF